MFTVFDRHGPLLNCDSDREAVKLAYKWSFNKKHRHHVKTSEGDLIYDTAERVTVNSVGSYYADDGTLMDANEARSIFDDVDL